MAGAKPVCLWLVRLLTPPGLPRQSDAKGLGEGSSLSGEGSSLSLEGLRGETGPDLRVWGRKHSPVLS